MMPVFLLVVPALVKITAPEPAFGAASENHAEQLFQQGRDLRYAQRWYEAAQAYRTLLREFPATTRAADARYWLAASLEQDRRWDEAIDAYAEFLSRHPDQRLLGKEARLNRVRCWGIRQWDNPAATPGLVSALADEREEVRIAAALQMASQVGFPDWVTVDEKQMKGTLKSVPERDEILPDINENLVVELYSK